eukprot:COSAG02_NODE_5722_length_4095_cov_5.657908_2_plen_104_part_00
MVLLSSQYPSSSEVGPKDVRKREAKRRLMDLDIKDGQPGSDLCWFTTYSSQPTALLQNNVASDRNITKHIAYRRTHLDRLYERSYQRWGDTRERLHADIIIKK